MTEPSITKAIEPIVSMFTTTAILLVVVAAISFFVAQTFGKTRVARQIIFTIVSFIGICGAVLYTSSRLGNP